MTSQGFLSYTFAIVDNSPFFEFHPSVHNRFGGHSAEFFPDIIEVNIECSMKRCKVGLAHRC